MRYKIAFYILVVCVVLGGVMLSRFFRRSSSDQASDVARHIPSPHGNRPNVSPVPLLVYGHQAAGTAKVIAEGSTISCLAVKGLDNLVKVLDGRPLIGLEAMSPRDAPGEAGKAIALFHAKYPQGMALYASWSYNVERSAKRAIEYGAQGIVMPGIDVRDMLTYIVAIGRRTDSGKPAPSTFEEHVQLLREYTPKSPFWMLQDKPDGPSY